MSRLSIEISNKQHKHIKALAAIQGKSIKELVLERIFKDLNEEDADLEELKTFLNDRIKHAEKGAVSTKSPNQIAQEVLRRNNVL